MFKDYEAQILIFNMTTTYEVSIKYYSTKVVIVSTAQVLTFSLFVPNEFEMKYKHNYFIYNEYLIVL